MSARAGRNPSLTGSLINSETFSGCGVLMVYADHGQDAISSAGPDHDFFVSRFSSLESLLFLLLINSTLS